MARTKMNDLNSCSGSVSSTYFSQFLQQRRSGHRRDTPCLHLRTSPFPKARNPFHDEHGSTQQINLITREGSITLPLLQSLHRIDNMLTTPSNNAKIKIKIIIMEEVEVVITGNINDAKGEEVSKINDHCGLPPALVNKTRWIACAYFKIINCRFTLFSEGCNLCKSCTIGGRSYPNGSNHDRGIQATGLSQLASPNQEIVRNWIRDSHVLCGQCNRGN